MTDTPYNQSGQRMVRLNNKQVKIDKLSPYKQNKNIKVNNSNCQISISNTFYRQKQEADTIRIQNSQKCYDQIRQRYPNKKKNIGENKSNKIGNSMQKNKSYRIMTPTKLEYIQETTQQDSMVIAKNAQSEYFEKNNNKYQNYKKHTFDYYLNGFQDRKYSNKKFKTSKSLNKSKNKSQRKIIIQKPKTKHQKFLM